MSDFRSHAAKSWYGNYNYLVLSNELYYQQSLYWWKDQIPVYVGIMVINTASKSHFIAKRPVLREVSDERKRVLERSLLRTLFYQNTNNRNH